MAEAKVVLDVVRYVWMLKHGGHVPQTALRPNGTIDWSGGPPPATPTDCINQHPFSLRRVWRMDPLDFRNQFSQTLAAAPVNLSREKPKLLLLEGNHL